MPVGIPLSGVDRRPVAPPEAVGLNSLILGDLKNHMGPLAAANIRSVLVVRRRTLI